MTSSTQATIAVSSPQAYAPQPEPALACPNCAGRGMQVFYRVSDIPVHSCLPVASAEEAAHFPTGALELAVCDRCGFIGNARFDPRVHNYSPAYEETQGFSPTFNHFARALAQRLVADYGLRGKDVLEIGCGKGEFLALLCELGAARGIGIDPSFIRERLASDAAARLTFIRDFYSEKYADLKADFVCCRHTLEHIAPTRAFVQTLRRALGERTDTLVFFEVPDTMRILREGAFWDIYYEHCSYFTTGSLARLFRACGFEVLALELDYDDQYILLVARPAPGVTKPSLPAEADLGAVAAAVRTFTTTLPAKRDPWRQRLVASAAQGRRTVIWGSGSKGVAFLTTLRLFEEIEYVVDINPHKDGKFMPTTGQRIVRPEFLTTYRPDCVIAMNPVYCAEIHRDLARLGLRPEVLAV